MRPRSATSRSTRGGSRRGARSSACRARARRARLRRGGGRARRGRARRRAAARRRGAAARRRGRRARRWRSRPTAFFGEPTRELEVAGVTGTNGKTTTAFLLRAMLERRRPAAGPRRHGRVGRGRRAARPAPPHDARGDRPAAAVPRDARRGRRAACAMEASSHGSAFRRLDRVRFDALVFTNLDAGPPRLPRRRWRTTSRRSAACSPGAQTAAGRGERRRPVRAAARRRARATPAARRSSRSGCAATRTCGPRGSS